MGICMISGLVLAHIFDEDLLNLTIQCFKSLENQLDEIVYVDGGSEIEYKPPGARILRFEKDPGFIACVNAGIDELRGDYAFFISNDTHIIEGNLKDMVCDGLSFPKVKWIPWDYTSDEWHGGFYGFPNDPFYKHSTDYNYYYTDTDLFERAKQKQIPFYRFNNIVIGHRVNSTTNKTGGRKKYYEKDKEIFRKKYGYAPN